MKIKTVAKIIWIVMISLVVISMLVFTVAPMF
jgi:hypothetical protein